MSLQLVLVDDKFTAQTKGIISVRLILAAAAALSAVASLTPARAAVIALSPDPLDFGDVLVGIGGTASLTVEDTAGRRNQPVAGTFGTSPRLGGGGGGFTLASQGSTATETYSWSPNKRGATLNGKVGAHGVAADGTTSDPTVGLAGLAVAPVEDVGVDGAGNVRIGTTGVSAVTVANTGDGNLSGLGAVSNLNGVAGSVSTNRFNGAGGSFSLSDGATATFDYAYTPKNHTTNTTKVTVDTANGSADGKDQPTSTTLKLSGTGVGPVYASSAPGPVIDIGTFAPGISGSVSLTIANLSTDPGGTDLIGLTLLRDRLRGPDRADFAVSGFIRGEVLDEGDSVVLDLDFLGDFVPGLYTANLRIVTDQDAAFGARGDVFRYRLEARVGAVPEPGSLALLSSGLLGLVLYGRRRTAG